MSHPYLPAVIALVQRAGQATLPHWRNDVAVLDAANASAAPLRAAARRVQVDALRPYPGAGRGAVEALRCETVDDEAMQTKA